MAPLLGRRKIDLTDKLYLYRMIALPAPLATSSSARSRVNSAPRGIRIPVAALKGLCPRPLDDGGNIIIVV